MVSWVKFWICISIAQRTLLQRSHVNGSCVRFTPAGNAIIPQFNDGELTTVDPPHVSVALKWHKRATGCEDGVYKTLLPTEGVIQSCTGAIIKAPEDTLSQVTACAHPAASSHTLPQQHYLKVRGQIWTQSWNCVPDCNHLLAHFWPRAVSVK